MNFQVTAQYLQHYFPAKQLNHEWIVENLNLDLGHTQLLRDCFKVWDTDERLVAMMFCLVNQINQGSLCLELHDIDFQQNIRDMGINKPIEVKECQQWSRYRLKDKPVLIFEKGAVYFAKYWQTKHNLAQSLQKLLKNYSGPVFNDEQICEVTQEVVSELTFDSIENKQILAIVVSLIQPFSIISGGPGTGKTTIMSSILRGLIKLGYQPQDIIMAAPTGRAANRMTESLHDVLSKHIEPLNEADKQLMTASAMTIHRLLGSHPYRGGFDHGLHNPLNCRVLVVDEVSMVDVMLMKQLLQSVPKDCRVLLLGDQFQLPSVESGAVLADLMPPLGQDAFISQNMQQQLSQVLQGFNGKDTILELLTVTDEPQLLTDKVTVLDVSKRCQPDIAVAGELVRCGDSEGVVSSTHWQKFELNKLGKPGVFHWPAIADYTSWLSFCQSWVKHHYFTDGSAFKQAISQLRGFDEHQLGDYKQWLDDLFNAINSNRILTLLNQSVLGSQIINESLAEMMRTQLGSIGRQNLFHGSVIMLQKNDASLQLFNGDIGVLLETKGGQLRVVLPFKNNYQSHSIHVIPAFKSAYAMTVHKSQGSEYEHVLMPLLPDGQHLLMTRELIYTGMTRAKKSVLLVGDEQAFKTAIQRQTKRHTGLRFWYN